MNITLEELKQKYTELGAMIKAYEEQAEAEFLKEGDTYYVRDRESEVLRYTYNDDSIDEYYISRGLFGRTVEELNFKEERLKVFATLERCGGVWKTKTSEANEYCLYGAMLNTVVGIEVNNTGDCLPNIWFPTKEQAQKAIDTIGEERLLKYWFCVEV